MKTRQEMSPEQQAQLERASAVFSSRAGVGLALALIVAVAVAVVTGTLPLGDPILIAVLALVVLGVLAFASVRLARR